MSQPTHMFTHECTFTITSCRFFNNKFYTFFTLPQKRDLKSCHGGNFFCFIRKYFIFSHTQREMNWKLFTWHWNVMKIINNVIVLWNHNRDPICRHYIILWFSEKMKYFCIFFTITLLILVSHEWASTQTHTLSVFRFELEVTHDIAFHLPITNCFHFILWYSAACLNEFSPARK
jgi:hypothetical protein